MARNPQIPSTLTDPLRRLLLGAPILTGPEANAAVVSWYPKDWIQKHNVTYRSHSSWHSADSAFDLLTFPDHECNLQIDAWWIWRTNFATIKASRFVFSQLTQEHSWSFTSPDFSIGVSGDYTIHATPDPATPSELEIDLAHWGGG